MKWKKVILWDANLFEQNSKLRGTSVLVDTFELEQIL